MFRTPNWTRCKDRSGRSGDQNLTEYLRHFHLHHLTINTQNHRKVRGKYNLTSVFCLLSPVFYFLSSIFCHISITITVIRSTARPSTGRCAMCGDPNRWPQDDRYHVCTMYVSYICKWLPSFALFPGIKSLLPRPSLPHPHPLTLTLSFTFTLGLSVDCWASGYFPLFPSTEPVEASGLDRMDSYDIPTPRCCFGSLAFG